MAAAGLPLLLCACAGSKDADEPCPGCPTRVQRCRNSLPRALHLLHQCQPYPSPLGRAGEVLGCTAPVVADGADAIVFVADGRFHLEAIMIANPDIAAFRCGASTPSRRAGDLRVVMAGSPMPKLQMLALEVHVHRSPREVLQLM